jgi:hypothetical protein
MACINPNDPKFQEILARVGNPILAEIEFNKYQVQYDAAKSIIAEKIIKSISTNTYTFIYNSENDTLSLVPQPGVQLTLNKARNAVDSQSSKSNRKNITNYRLTPIITKDWEPKLIKIDFNLKFVESQIPQDVLDPSLLPSSKLTELEEVSPTLNIQKKSATEFIYGGEVYPSYADALAAQKEDSYKEQFKSRGEEFNKNKNYQLPSNEGQIASEKTIRDLAARMSDRIGMQFKIESDRTKQYKGKFENGIAYINLAYATLDTPIHEILGHPIIRAIKNRGLDNRKIEVKKTTAGYQVKFTRPDGFIDNSEIFKTEEEANKYAENFKIKGNPELYQNLLKELEYGRGKEVLDRIKRDYVNKEAVQLDNGEYIFENKEYTLEEQQEEAIVELLGMMTAEKLDNVKDGKLISLLKRLLKEMKQFVRSLLNLKEVEIDKLPDNMTIGDLADLLAYSNSKLILPGYEVEYTTPDNQKFKTYAEASNHISQLAKNVKEVDLSKVNLEEKKKYSDSFEIITNILNEDGSNTVIQHRHYKENGKWYSRKKAIKNFKNYTWEYDKKYNQPERIEINPTEEELISLYKQSEEFNNSMLTFGEKSEEDKIKDFIEKNKEYEQSKEVIKEWKKVNNIQYNPEEIYSRGQEFSSVVGAYSDFDINVMMQNLLQHIEDNEKAGGEFTISAFTKPIDRKIRHLEEGGGKIKFKIYPQSKDIKWAANTDVYSGSVWDASEKISKNKKSELLGVSYTKYPSLFNVNRVQPNLASIVDDLAHHHNELGISLTGNNFRLEYDENIPYQTKKIIDSVNAILDQKYGKLVKPEIKKFKKQTILIDNPLPENQRSGVLSYSSDIDGGYFLDTVYAFERRGYALGDNIPYWQVEKILKIAYPNSVISLQFYTNKVLVDGEDIVTYSGLKYETPDKIEKEVSGIQPTQTQDNLKESIESVKNTILETKTAYSVEEGNLLRSEGWVSVEYNHELEEEYFEKPNKKEYTEQALINTKIAKLKEVAKKYPRSLIRSEVKNSHRKLHDELFEIGELPFQKIPEIKPGVEELFNENPELANQVYEASGFKTTITQDDKSYYRGQIEKPTIDKDGNLVLYGREDDLYKRAGLKSKGVSMTSDLQSAIDYGNGQLEVAQNLASESYDENQELERLSENGYYLIQIPKNVSNEIVKEAGEVKVIGDKIIIPKGQYKIEQVVDGVEQITPQQKQQAIQLYSQHLDTVFPNRKVKDVLYHGTDLDKNDVTFKSDRGGIFLASTLVYASYFSESENVYPVLVNFKNTYEAKGLTDNIGKKEVEIIKSRGYDSVIGKGGISKMQQHQNDLEYIAFKPEQIYPLGTKQDIERFKEFVGSVSNVQEAQPIIPINEMEDIIDNLPPFTKDIEDLGFTEEACDL